jgi:CheY-like chemotaxis protein
MTDAVTTVSPKGRLLIIDDDEFARATSEAHVSREGYEIRFAPDGLTGIAAALSERPDVILLDVMMPGIDGFEVCRRLKADPRTRDIPVIILTALSEKSDAQRCIDAGADEFTAKPVFGTELRTRVWSMMRLKHLSDALHAAVAELAARSQGRGATDG